VVNLQISYNDPGLAVAGPRATPDLDDYINADEGPSTNETGEEHNQNWTVSGTPVDPSAQLHRDEFGPGDHLFYGADDGAGPNDQYLISPPLNVGVGVFGFTFQHIYSFENDGVNFYDGGVLELSTDNGANWVDIGAFATPTYGPTPIFTRSGSAIVDLLAQRRGRPCRRAQS